MVFDTNVLIYAVDQDSPFHSPCRDSVLQARNDPSPAFLTWNVCYEFLRATTHARASVSPWTTLEAWDFLEVLLHSPGFDLLAPTQRHAAVLARILKELPDVSGNLVHDLHTAVLMREHGISRICTRDTDFHRFPFLEVVDPLR
ncbi:MAG: PIN domain-containing protein [Bryobacterales bacterium]|nr:PIN domain-containing protein [Bryobacterales bacterium]MDE0296059.1 PIN domain-containing protein [Bryobacterales bacterium]MDE0434001.1 PIN domain-containing protein [Bryobacterales bacterium]